MPAPLEMFLRQFTSGHRQGLSPEMYQHFGGDDILAQIQKYDPNAKWTDVSLSGGEGGDNGQMGKRLDYDEMKIPAPQAGWGAVPSNLTGEGVRDKRGIIDDDLYGSSTDSRNVIHKAGTLDKALPYIAMAISMGGPMLAAQLAAAGIGGAGLTSAVTGSGLTGLNTYNLPDFLVKQMAKMPQYGRQLSKGNMSLSSLIPGGAGAAGSYGAQSLSDFFKG